eukprot:TRINITY_DN3151_c0_g1_i1.p1 TRINITY_DN3151_c0_g1~~TRINITY_DN3151_c0_g1_i1.p1  ORF type:complete len:911 (-),score=216.68 TRINITY_DN3151_c0_g1_i1:1684-4416(-)
MASFGDDDGAWQGDKMADSYEGGRWINGDFYYSKEKKGKKMSKERAALGIFGGDSDDEDERPSFGGRGGGGGGRDRERTAVDYSRPMNFVSAGVVDPNKNKPIEDVEMQDEDNEYNVDKLWDQRDQRGGLGTWSRDSAEDDDAMDVDGPPDAKRRKINDTEPMASSGADEQPKKKKKKKSSKVPAAPAGPPVGAWEKFTKGIGAKLLKKMGWEEGKGLGPQLQGISNPIEARLRSGREGLTEGEYKGEALNRWEKDGEEEESGGEEGADESSEEDKKPKEPGWKKGAKKPKPKYLTAAEAAAKAAAASPKQLIVDMTGPQVRVLNSVDQIVKGPADAAGSAAPKPSFLPQLSYNITKLVDMKASRMHVLDVKRRHEEQQLAALRREESSLQQRMQAQEGLLMRLQDIQKIVSGCRDRLGSDSGLTLDFAAKVFELLKGKFTYEYRKYKLEAIGHSLVFPLITRKLKDWNPLTHPDYGVAMMKSWRHIFSGDDVDTDRDVMDMDDAEFEEDFFGRKKAHGDSSAKKQGDFDLFNRLLHEVVIPKFRNTIMVDWNPKDPAPLISVLVSWSEILSAPYMDILVSSAILPRLQATVEAWDPRRDTVPVHSWVLPWLRFMNAGDRVRATLFDPIQRKLSQALVQWQATDRSALILLKPWHTVFEDGAWERLLLKSIIPKLLDALRSKFAIDPSNQDLAVFKAVLLWLEVTPVQHFVTLLDLEFFPKFFSVLHAWLSSDEPDFDEVTAWYMSWKQQFPDLLQNQDRIKQLFAYALKMMNSALSADSPDQILAPPPAPHYSPLSFTPSKARSQNANSSQIIPQEPGDSQRAANAAAPKKRTNTTFMDTVSLKELLESMAAEKNILFMPIPNKTSGGKPVYKLGSQQVWFDKDLVHKWADGGWKPIHIDDLLDDAAQS